MKRRDRSDQKLMFVCCEMRADGVWVDGEGAPVHRLGPRRVAIFLEENSKVVVRAEVIWIDGDGDPVHRLGLRRFALTCEDVSDVVERADIRRVEDEGAPKLSLGLLCEASLRKVAAEFDMNGDLIVVHFEKDQVVTEKIKLYGERKELKDVSKKVLFKYLKSARKSKSKKFQRKRF